MLDLTYIIEGLYPVEVVMVMDSAILMVMMEEAVKALV
jgi:hypothetical protein